MALQSRDIDGIDADGKAKAAAAGQREAAGDAVKGRGDWSMVLLRAGGWLCVIAFGGLFWLVNGGFSVTGLREISLLLGDGGVLFWRAVSVWHSEWSQDRIGQQPIIPWVGVLAASIFQVALIVRGLQGKSTPVWAWALGIILSGYDAATTYFGLDTVQWVQSAGWIAKIPITALVTFGLEGLIGFLLRRKR
jgi:hypothetical protein